MDIGDDGQLAFAAFRPQLGKSVAAQSADAAGVSVGVELVVVDGIRDLAPAVDFLSEQEGAGLVTAASPTLKLADNLAPETGVAGDAVIRRYERPYSRFD